MKKFILILICFVVSLAFTGNDDAYGSRSKICSKSSKSKINSKNSSSKGGLKSSSSTVKVRPYTKKNETYVPSHLRTAPNNTKRDNWSSKGNVNPYTGKEGTKDPGH